MIYIIHLDLFSCIYIVSAAPDLASDWMFRKINNVHAYVLPDVTRPLFVIVHHVSVNKRTPSWNVVHLSTFPPHVTCYSTIIRTSI